MLCALSVCAYAVFRPRLTTPTPHTPHTPYARARTPAHSARALPPPPSPPCRRAAHPSRAAGAPRAGWRPTAHPSPPQTPP
eukprot:2866384-Prymnesium_polylepis.1